MQPRRKTPQARARPALGLAILAGLTLLMLALSLPGSLRDAYERGGLYLFSVEFLEDLPKRLTGPGRFRFVLQPAIAAALGIVAGRTDARAGRPTFVYTMLFGAQARGEAFFHAVQSIGSLLLMGVLLDSVCQWLILGASYPGPALVVGPVLITIPYAVARSLANRVLRG
ncbi:MAG TPA: hypothetical protein VEK15_14650 [Vicinamibacteria bacterium]|nr:hypothetical protein [Vicinamibacteria bacterium]